MQADIGTDMTAYAFVVIGVDVTAHRTLVFLDPENGVFRTINYAVVTLEAHAATHAAGRFINRFLFF